MREAERDKRVEKVRCFDLDLLFHAQKHRSLWFYCSSIVRDIPPLVEPVSQVTHVSRLTRTQSLEKDSRKV